MSFHRLVNTTAVSIANEKQTRNRIAELKRSVSDLEAINRTLEDALAQAHERINELAQNQTIVERNQRAVAASQDGLWDRCLDADEEDIWVSDEWKKTFGLGPSDNASFSGFVNQIHPEDRNRFYAEMGAATERGGAYTCEYRVLDYSVKVDAEHSQASPNQYIWVRAAGRVVTSNGKKYLSGSHNNVTERREREEGFAEMERVYNSIVSAIPHMVFVKNDRHEFQLANDAIGKFFGLSDPNVALGRTDKYFSLREHERAKCVRDDQRVLIPQQFEDGTLGSLDQLVTDEELTDSAGNSHWFRTVKKPIVYKNQRCVLGISTEITANIRTERELRQIIRQTPVPIYTTDGQGRLQVVNQPFLELLQYHGLNENQGIASIKGRLLRDVVSSQMLKVFEEADSMAESKGRHEAEVKLGTGTESREYRLIRVKRHSEVAGDYGGILAVTIDLTSSIAVERLESERQRVEALNVGFRSMTHSLLEVCSDALCEEIATTKIEDFESRRREWSEILGFILDYTQRLRVLEPTDRGGVDLTFSNRTLKNTLQSAIAITNRFVENPQVRFDVDSPAFDRKVTADHTLLRVVLVELLHNSKKYTLGTAAKTAKVIVTAVLIKDESDNEALLRVTVSDQGAGPTEDVDGQPEQWFKLYRSWNPPGMDNRGSGLGLRFCDLVVRAHGGKFFLPKKNGECGTVMSFELPITATDYKENQ